MKAKSYRYLASIVIVFMFIIIIGYIGTSNAQYVFSYQNEDVIYNGNRENNNVSLMVNVYWGSEFISEMLDIFEKYDVKTTFFVGGQWAEKEEEILKDLFNRGHEIGNHGYFHKDQEKLSYDQNYDEINVNHQLVKSILNTDMNLFAPPSGSFNKSTLQASKDLGYQTIMWSKDTIDWRDKDSNLVYKRATENILGGDLILMHPTEHTVKALPLILEFYKLNNITATTVTNCLK
jgi:peptidoglycan/xylan/chitin deacetylase (PgdA/CDA1 family)